MTESVTYVELEGPTAWNAVKKRTLLGLMTESVTYVELEGIEPSSKQGDHKLSTCLVQFWFSCKGLTWTTEPMPYPLRFHWWIKAFTNYSRICCTAYPTASGRGLSARCLVPMSNKGMKLIYYTSIMLREHKYCCQINFCKDGIKEPVQGRSACLPTTSSCCQIHVNPRCSNSDCKVTK